MRNCLEVDQSHPWSMTPLSLSHSQTRWISDILRPRLDRIWSLFSRLSPVPDCIKKCQNGGTCLLSRENEQICKCMEGFNGDFCEGKYIYHNTFRFQALSKFHTLVLTNYIPGLPNANYSVANIRIEWSTSFTLQQSKSQSVQVSGRQRVAVQNSVWKQPLSLL